MNVNLGYGLLAGGIFLIIFSAINIVLVLTKNIEPLQFYSPDEVSFDFSSMIPSSPVTLNRTTTSPVSSDLLAQSFNLLIHLFLMGFLVNVGSKIAIIGTQLVRPIVVKVNKKDHSSEE